MLRLARFSAQAGDHSGFHQVGLQGHALRVESPVQFDLLCQVFAPGDGGFAAGAFGQLVGFGVDLLDLCRVVGVAEPGVEVLEDGGIFSEYFIVVNERVRRALHLFLHQFGEALVRSASPLPGCMLEREG